MRTTLVASLGAALVALVAACDEGQPQMNHGPLSPDEAAVAVHVPCLDRNGDKVIGRADAGQPLSGGAEAAGNVPDFDADGEITDADARFLDVEMSMDPAIDPAACEQETPVDFLVGSADQPAIDCASGRPAVVVVGVAGGIANLSESDDGAGVRFIVRGVTDELRESDVQTLGVIAGPAVPGLATTLHGGMETWLTHAVETYLEVFPCARAVLIGHSHGAVTTDVVAARLEDRYADRIRLVVRLDRVPDLYFGDTTSMPEQVPVLNIFETNEEPHGEPDPGQNAENFDASGETGPEKGEEGGPEKPVNHSTIDNSESVRQRIVDAVVDRVV